MRRTALRTLQAVCAALVLLLGVGAFASAAGHDPAPSHDASATPAVRDGRRGHDDAALRGAALRDVRASATGHGSHPDLLAVLAAAGACVALLLGWCAATPRAARAPRVSVHTDSVPAVRPVSR